MARRLALLLLLMGIELAAQNVRFAVIDPAVIAERFHRLGTVNTERADVIRSLFADAGCGASLSKQEVKHSKLPNLICTLPGSSEQRVVVTAHYDKVKDGEGAVDNWSGAALLSSLYQSLSPVPRTLTFVFVATTDEEKGLVGARGYWDELSKEDRRKIRANVNLDSIGLPEAIYVWAGQADRELLRVAATVASALQIPLQGVDVDDGLGDSSVFLQHRIPTIDFHSVTPESFKLLHTKKDVQTAVDQPTYYSTFRLVTGFLALLDAQAATAVTE